jgi:hypothetical protein
MNLYPLYLKAFVRARAGSSDIKIDVTTEKQWELAALALGVSDAANEKEPRTAAEVGAEVERLTRVS